MPDLSEIATMIDDIMNRSNKLSEWEQNFISDMYGREEFTPRQLEKIDQIWERVT